MLEKRDLGKYAIISLVFAGLIMILLFFNGRPTGYAVYYGGPGEGQTTLMLQTAGSDNFGDAYVGSAGDAGKNFGLSDLLETGSVARTYINFNISRIPLNQNIDNSKLCLYILNTKKIQLIGVNHVYNNFNESALIWNNQPCGINFNNSNACNLTSESSFQMDSAIQYVWVCWNVTNMVGKDYYSGKQNILMVLYTSDANINSFYSKEYSDTGLRPYLNITYRLSDIISPSLSIVYPANNINTSNNQISINYKVSDANLQVCWYSNDTMTTNTTLANCANITTVTWAEGQHNIIVWANDSVGNLNSSSVSFYVDSVLPNVNILFPQEGTTYGYNTSIALNYSAYDLNLESCWYNLNNENNISLSNCANTTFNVAGDGNYILNIYANDSLGLVSGDSVNFNVQVGSPTIVLNSPMDSYLDNQAVIFSYTPTDIDLDYCELWGNFDGEFKLNQTDNSPDNGIENTFNLNLNNGVYLWNIRCFDDIGNSAFNGNKTFYVDTINPLVSLTQPTGVKTSRTVSASWSVSDTNLNDCWYNVYRGASLEISNTSITCSDNTANFEVTVDANFVFNFYVDDSAGNSNNANLSFSVDTSTPSSPASGGSSGGGGGGGSGGSLILPNQTGKLQVSLIGNIIASPGENKKIPLTVKNIGKIFLNKCRLIANGDIISWVYSTNVEGIAPGQSVDFIFDLNVPEEIILEINKGSLEVKCEEAINIQNISVSIPKEFNLIEIKDIKQEDNLLKINYTFDSSKFVGDNIDIEIWLSSENGTELMRIVDKSPMDKEGLIERSVEMQLPEGLEGGVYIIYFAFSNEVSNFIKKPVVLSITGKAVLDSEKGKFWVYIVFLLILGTAIFFIWRRHSKTDKTKKQKNDDSYKFNRLLRKKK